MPSYSSEFKCPCDYAVLLRIVNGDAAQWKVEVSNTDYKLTCPMCGCSYVVEDDEIPAADGGGIRISRQSPPMIDSVEVHDGPIIGGTDVTITGHGFDVGTLVVTFDGVPGTDIDVTSGDWISVISPAGTVRVVAATDRYTRFVTHSVSAGPFIAGETVVGQNNGGHAVVRHVGGAFLMVDAVEGQFADGERVVGEISGASTTLNSDPTRLQFIVGETIEGVTSGASAVVRKLDPLRVDSVLGSFAGNEDVWGRTSGARVRVAQQPFDGRVDVGVSNEWGTRENGATLDGSFEYLL